MKDVMKIDMSDPFSRKKQSSEKIASRIFVYKSTLVMVEWFMIMKITPPEPRTDEVGKKKKMERERVQGKLKS